jgi:hypothetical protein
MEENNSPKKKSKLAFLFILILALLALCAIAVPSWKPYRTAGYNAAAKIDLKKFYAASQSYFVKNPSGIIDIDTAKKYGYQPTFDVKIIVMEGSRDKLKATAVHESGTKTYTVEKQGNIEEKNNN